jgi:hypothetical protein
MCVWATGTLTAFAGAKFPPHTCKAPYTGWALTWPIWKIMPTAVEVRFVAWTFTFCE